MTIEHKPFINRGQLVDLGLETFFQKTLEYLRCELQLLHNSNYIHTLDEKLFALNERAWVGTFNNAIIRAFPGTVTLQEFGVYDNESKYKGRVDLLVIWTNPEGKKFTLLFEAKQCELRFKPQITRDSVDYFNSVRDQAESYIKVKSEYYKDQATFIIPIIFGWIRIPKCLHR